MIEFENVDVTYPGGLKALDNVSLTIESGELVAAAIKKRLPDVALSTSSNVVPEFQEFERTSTTILNAYLMPSVARYLRSLAEGTEGAGPGTGG